MLFAEHKLQHYPAVLKQDLHSLSAADRFCCRFESVHAKLFHTLDWGVSLHLALLKNAIMDIENILYVYLRTQPHAKGH